MKGCFDRDEMSQSLAEGRLNGDTGHKAVGGRRRTRRGENSGVPCCASSRGFIFQAFKKQRRMVDYHNSVSRKQNISPSVYSLMRRGSVLVGGKNWCLIFKGIQMTEPMNGFFCDFTRG